MARYQSPYETNSLVNKTHFTIQYSKNVRDATKRIKKILDANYEKANLKNLKYLNNDKQSYMLKLLRKHEEIFHGTLDSYTGTELKIELLEGAKPSHTMPNLFQFLKYKKKL